MASKGYPTLNSDGPATEGSLGAVGGLSTSDTIVIKESFPNSPFWKNDDEY